MRNTFPYQLARFAKAAYRFEADSAAQKLQCLQALAQLPLPSNRTLLQYHILLLFTLTHAENRRIYQQANQALLRFARHLQQPHIAQLPFLADSGLPYTPMVTRFTQDAFYQLIQNKEVDISVESLNNEAFNLNGFLNITLPALLKEETTAGMNNDDILQHLGVDASQRFNFLLQQIKQLQCPPLVKDYIWQSLQSFFTVKGKTHLYSKSFNRLNGQPLYFTQRIGQPFDHWALLQQKLPRPTQLSPGQLADMLAVIQYSMPLSMREIDTITYLNPATLRYFQLESGLSVAIYGMQAERQLPLQSFVGCTLFKNGYPMSYGASWIFGECAMFGLNIFEEFRGGESKYLMTQIMRVYVQHFGLSFYEIEPFQFGNEEAIRTGAFWFYYKFGFRPVEPALQKLAAAEAAKIKADRQYRSSAKTLEKLAQGNLAIHLNEQRPIHRNAVMQPILAMVANQYKGDSWAAVADAKKYFMEQTGFGKKLNAVETTVLEEVALWAMAHGIRNQTQLQIMVQMVKAKPKDIQRYNRLIQQCLALS
jgi:hypothetical protein